MRSLLSRIWHVLIVRICFLLFGIGGILMSWLFFPVLALLPGSKEKRQQRARAVIRFCFQGLLQILQKTGVMRLVINGQEYLQESGGKLILANHPTYIDVVILLALIPNGDCIIKAALWDGLSYGKILRSAGFIRNDTPETMITDCVKSLEKGDPLVIFPEGTRTDPGGKLKFLRGSAHILLAARVPFIPILVRCDPPALSKVHRWHQVPEQTFEVKLEILPPQSLETFCSPENTDKISARELTAALERFFTEGLQHHV